MQSSRANCKPNAKHIIHQIPVEFVHSLNHKCKYSFSIYSVKGMRSCIWFQWSISIAPTMHNGHIELNDEIEHQMHAKSQTTEKYNIHID